MVIIKIRSIYTGSAWILTQYWKIHMVKSHISVGPKIGTQGNQNLYFWHNIRCRHLTYIYYLHPVNNVPGLASAWDFRNQDLPDFRFFGRQKWPALASSNKWSLMLMDTTIKPISEVLRSEVEREEQWRLREQIGLSWSEQSKDNQIIADWGDQMHKSVIQQLGVLQLCFEGYC